MDKVLPHPWYCTICVASADRPVGSISVKPADDLLLSEPEPRAPHCCRASVGYRVVHVHWGHGNVHGKGGGGGGVCRVVMAGAARGHRRRGEPASQRVASSDLGFLSSGKALSGCCSAIVGSWLPVWSVP
ncbi:hypothetical protein E2562_010856 [Oryza meyeriana var. granulata]|uniref:Uncharacterized protein n=1 Tax=Oryza meyeriana var. granulata TaxID=110450 RepID=A0A6G1BIK4_9ORYZ|nr:hypothetical protein E2562_010856 [Oryza meyeriana var. granulata]